MISESGSSVGVLVAAGLSLVLIGVAVRAQQLRARKSKQNKGLMWLSSFRILLSHVQRHRGLTTGYLNGGLDLVGDIQELQRLISRDIANISAVDMSIEENSRWQGITQHWARLAGNYKRSEVENNLSQHNHLIKNVLYLIDDIAQDYDLLMLKSAANKPLHLYWRELLSAAEYIGQARAIGTGVSAAEHCDSVSRIRLNYLCQQIDVNTQRLWKEIGVDEKQSERVSKLIRCINEHVIMDRPDIPPAEFFAIASEALDGLLEKFDELIKQQRWS